MKKASKTAVSAKPAAVPELDTPRYLLSDAAAAADIDVGLLKAWISREPNVVSLGPHDRLGRGKGTPRLLTRRRLINIALTAELVSLGFAASKAGTIAAMFTDLVIDLSDDVREDFAKDGIKYSGVFVESGDPIFLVVHPAREGFNVVTSAKATFHDAMAEHENHPLVSCVVVNCGELMNRVEARLKERGLT